MVLKHAVTNNYSLCAISVLDLYPIISTGQSLFISQNNVVEVKKKVSFMQMKMFYL